MRKTLLDLPITVKVLIAPLFVLLCLLLLAGVGYYTGRLVDDALQRTVNSGLPQMEDALQLKTRTAKLEASVMRSLAYEGAGMKAKRIEALDKAIKGEMAALTKEIANRKAAADPSSRVHYENIERALAEFARLATDTLEMKSGGLSEAAMMMTSAESSFVKLEKAVDELAATIVASARHQASDASSALVSTLRVGLVALLSAMVVSALVIAWSSRMITRPLREAVSIAQDVAAGNLRPIERVERQDETGQVLSAMDELRGRLSQLLGSVQQAAQQIEGASAEIATGNMDLSTRTEQTAAALQSTAGTVRQLLEQMSSHAQAAAQANDLARHTAEAARQGGQATQEAVVVMEQVSADARRISDIIGVIDGIAFQTNILALNAAVEAARAGEQGRGFAVVAQEVRALAGRSAGAAREIRTLIQSSVAQVGVGAEKVQAAGQIIQEVVGSVERVSALMTEVAHGNADQTQSIARVDSALSDMDTSTQQNAALVEQAAAATNSLKDQAQGLRQSLGVFHTS